MTTTAETISNFGPLTTTFTPSPGCFTEKWMYYTSDKADLVWGSACGFLNSSIPLIQPATTCWPDGYNKAVEYLGVHSSANINGVFSPGNVCPSGWTVAYNSTYGQGVGTYNVGANTVTMQTGDILTACCPSNYALAETNCAIEVDNLGEHPSIGFASNGDCITSTIKSFNGTIGSSSNMVATLEATPIFLLENTLVSSSGGSAESTSGSSTDNGKSTGLSTGAKIAIGICIPAGVIILAAVLFIFWHRRNKSKSAESSESTAADPVHELPSSGVRAGELGGNDPQYGMSE
ncbi:hypothetical protein N7456_000520 [Penicillium angulare]|uniref:Uncharacterized protein n=1 Tax=Penicillium angulare TaxID=116970 RepID=A0A9W9GCA4_9EURO|nr:hypothetical protein N7456_000520 [Penicillium angulare]